MTNPHLNDIYKFASNRREFQSTDNRYQIPRFTRPESNRNQNTGEVKTCRYCKNIGHTIENCRKRQYNNSRYQPNASTSFGRPNQIRPFNAKTNPASRVFMVGHMDNDGVEDAENNLNN